MAFALGGLARAFPQVGWLRFVRVPTLRTREAQQARRRRSANRHTALEMILVGLALPLVYVATSVMFFNEIKTVAAVLVGAGSIGCVALGIWTLVRNRD
jgi:hypothetical protein